MQYVLLIFIIFLPLLSYSHSGGLNAQGCHAGKKPYHCHRSSSEMVGNRLRCDLGSKSEDCKSSPPKSSQDKKYVSTSENLILLEEYYFSKKTKSIDTPIYILQRCSALYMYISELIKNSNSEQSKSLLNSSEVTKKYATTFEAAKNNNLEIAKEKIDQNILAIKDIYEKNSNENYLLKGDYLSIDIKNDYKFCKFFIDKELN